jgi:hypothetical protein
VIGGEHEARIPIGLDIFELDLSAEILEWKLCPSQGGNTPQPRLAHGQAVIGDSIWIFGGRVGIGMGEGPLDDMHYFDTTTKEWYGPITAFAGRPPAPRSFHKMVSVGPRLYLFGGCAAVGRLNDLHVFDTLSLTWSELPSSADITGRGGPGFQVGSDGESLVVSSGYSGQENNDIHIFSLITNEWKQIPSDYRPRSVCPTSSVTLSGQSFMILYGGEVSPSDHGHEGAGDFASDLISINTTSSAALALVSAISEMPSSNSSNHCPMARGWTEMAPVFIARQQDVASIVMFGGLAGNDDNPVRLNDTWKLTVKFA